MPTRRRKPRDTPEYRARVKQYHSREHRELRQAGQREVDAGRAHCWRCGRYIAPGQPFHLGHDDHDRSIYRGTECPRCNLAAAGHKGAATVNRQRHTNRTGLRW